MLGGDCMSAFFSLFIAWMSHVMEVKHCSIVARVIHIHTTVRSSQALLYLHLLNSRVALVHSRQGISLSVLLHFIHSFSSELESLECPTQALSGPERTAQSCPSPQHSTTLKRLSTQWALLPAGRPIDAPLWVDCSLLERGGEGWSEWGRPNPTPGHWAWPSRCKHPALLSPWVGS